MKRAKVSELRTGDLFYWQWFGLNPDLYAGFSLCTLISVRVIDSPWCDVIVLKRGMHSAARMQSSSVARVEFDHQ